MRVNEVHAFTTLMDLTLDKWIVAHFVGGGGGWGMTVHRNRDMGALGWGEKGLDVHSWGEGGYNTYILVGMSL